MEESAKRREFFKIITLLKKTKTKQKQKKASVKPYTTTRINSRNFLSNISSAGITNKDFYNENFVFDVYALATKNLNPFLLERKIGDQNKQEKIYMLWK